MTAEIVELEGRVEQNFRKIHDSAVQYAIRSIKSNLNTHSIHILKPFIRDAMCSPEMLAIMSQEELCEVWDHISGEIQFRKEGGHA